MRACRTLPRLVIGRALQAKCAAAGEPVRPLPRVSLSKEIWFVTSMAVKILATEPIIQLLSFYNGFVLAYFLSSLVAQS